MTIAAISTPLGAGGVAVIRISGDEAISIADKVFKSKSGKRLEELGGYRALYGEIVEDGRAVDEAVALVFRAPKSYTGENVVELSCHGGIYTAKLVLRLVISKGARAASAGEFTKRAFLNGRLDLAEAEAVMNIISAQGEQALTAAKNTLSGDLSRSLRAVRERLVEMAAGLSVWADYPDEDIPSVEESALQKGLQDCLERLELLIKNYDCGRVLQQGVSCVICGRPNVGKSTLMNMLSGFERSIVTSVAGTTRDIVEDSVMLGEIALRLSDTAGIHSTADEVEKIGVARAVEALDNAVLLLPVFDGSEPLTEDDIEVLRLCQGRRAVAVINKTDKLQHIYNEEVTNYIEHCVSLSAKEKSGRQELEAAIREVLGANELDSSVPLLVNERQLACCREAARSLQEAVSALESGVTLDAVNVLIDEAINSVLELTGERATSLVVDEVFSKFCVGK